jgi:hypothetical protein
MRGRVLFRPISQVWTQRLDWLERLGPRTPRFSKEIQAWAKHAGAGSVLETPGCCRPDAAPGLRPRPWCASRRCRRRESGTLFGGDECRARRKRRRGASASAAAAVEGPVTWSCSFSAGAGADEFVGRGVGEDDDIAFLPSRGRSPLFQGRNYCPISRLDLCHYFGKDDTVPFLGMSPRRP